MVLHTVCVCVSECTINGASNVRLGKKCFQSCAMSKNIGDPTITSPGPNNQLTQGHALKSSGADNSKISDSEKLEVSSTGKFCAVRPSSATTTSSRPTSGSSNKSRPASSGTSRPSSSGTISSRPSSGSAVSTAACSGSSVGCGQQVGGGGLAAGCHSRTSSISSGDGLLLSVSALARGGVGNDTGNEAGGGGGQCMGQSGTRHALPGPGHTPDNPSGPPSGEREDPEGLTDGEEEIQSNLGSLLAVDKRVFGKLQEELNAAQSELKLKEEEVTRLSRIRDEVESELQELTASLFQEAHNMVREANVKAAHAEKALVESNMKVDGLMMEVAALKALVITSTPAKPNPHLHPQISAGKSSSSLRSISGASGGDSAPGTPTKERMVVDNDEVDGSTDSKAKFMDPVLRKEYMEWKQCPTMDLELPFFVRIYREDITPCLEFPNSCLSAQIKEAVQQNTICISPVKESMELPRNCELLEQPRRCTHIITLGEADTSKHFVSPLARNRIAAVCDFLLYCRYITQGLVKQHSNEVYWQITNRRKNMTLARLGFQEP